MRRAQTRDTLPVHSRINSFIVVFIELLPYIYTYTQRRCGGPLVEPGGGRIIKTRAVYTIPGFRFREGTETLRVSLFGRKNICIYMRVHGYVLMDSRRGLPTTTQSRYTDARARTKGGVIFHYRRTRGAVSGLRMWCSIGG